MSSEYKNKYIDAVFLEESGQRFLCTVLLAGREVECYVSSSSKISQYLDLRNQNILLSINKGKNLRTMYTLEALKTKGQEYVYLNFNKSNQMFEKHLIAQGVSEQQIHREKTINGSVKVDFYLDGQGCFEVKSLLSSTCEVDFPDSSSKRLYFQISEYIKLLTSGIKVTFVFIAMSPTLINFRWNTVRNDVKELFVKAVKLGMITQAYSVEFINGEFKLRENLKLQEQIIQSYFN